MCIPAPPLPASAPLHPRVFHLSSPDGQNRLSLDLLRAVAEAAVEPLVVAGNPQFFSVGADLNAISALAGAEAWRLAGEARRWLDAIAHAPHPVIAAVDGYCLGGGLDLALACHVRVCTPRAYFGHHGARLGLVTGWGGTQRLPRLIGRARALEHLLAARGWSGEEAVAQGLAQRLASPEELLDVAARIAGSASI